jgi:putative hydrolase of the HAD superfamily
MIRAVTLDFWNTLLDDSHPPARDEVRTARLYEIVAPYGYAPGPEAIHAAFVKVWRHFDRIWFKKSRTPSTAESAAVLLRALRIRLPQEARERVVTMLEEIILESPPRTVEGVPETLPLSPGRVLRRVLELHGLEQWFAAFFFSDEHGWSKPDPRAFLTPLAALGVAPAEAVHVGDIQRTDIAGAQAAGLQAIHFVGVNSADLPVSSAQAVVARFSELPAAISRLG